MKSENVLTKRLRNDVVELKVLPATARALHHSLSHAENGRLRCLACSRHCLLAANATGFCTAVTNWQDTLYSTAYGVIGEISVTPIENRPVYHYMPGTRTLCLGGLGCNLRCAFCQNWEVAFRDAHSGGDLAQPNLLPEDAIALALAQHCDGIAWTFNEPSIAPMYTFDTARLAHKAGLYTVFVTNGLMTSEALDLLGPYIDVYRIDIKSLDADFYRQVAHTAQIDAILPLAQRARQEFGIHLEFVTNLMPSLNDSDEHLERLADRLVTQFGSDTPWHLTTYVPYAYMTHIAPTPPETLERARRIGLQAGLRFVYTDNISAPETANTFCTACGACLIERVARQVRVLGLDSDGACLTCHSVSGIVMRYSSTSSRKGSLQ